MSRSDKPTVGFGMSDGGVLISRNGGWEDKANISLKFPPDDLHKFVIWKMVLKSLVLLNLGGNCKNKFICREHFF